MTDLQRRIADLPPEKRERLERRLAEVAATRTLDDRITACDRSQPIPLSFQQEREWAFAQFQPANNMPAALRIEGDLDLASFSRVLTKVVERHEVLRSIVELRDDGTVVQLVHAATPVLAPVVDLSDLTPAQQHEELIRRWKAELVQPFDQTLPSRIRSSVLRMAPDDHVALITLRFELTYRADLYDADLMRALGHAAGEAFGAAELGAEEARLDHRDVDVEWSDLVAKRSAVALQGVLAGAVEALRTGHRGDRRASRC